MHIGVSSRSPESNHSSFIIKQNNTYIYKINLVCALTTPRFGFRAHRRVVSKSRRRGKAIAALRSEAGVPGFVLFELDVLTCHIAVFTSRHDGRPIHLAREHRTKRPRKRNAHPAPNRPKTPIVATRHVINTHRTRAAHRTAALIFPSAPIHATVRSHVSYRSLKVLRVSYRFA